jgi:flagellar basal body-associated protein FliL
MEGELNQTKPMEKKSKKWLWIILGLLLIAVGVGIYFWLSGGDLPSIGNSIPQPPALPD